MLTYSIIILLYYQLFILYNYTILLSYYDITILSYYYIIILLYYYIIIRHRASGTRSVSGAPLLFLSSSQIWSCQFFCFKDSAAPAPNYLHDPFSDNFALFFRSTFFTTICAKKAPTGLPKTHQNLKNLQKIWPLNAPAAERWTKRSVWKG